MREQQLMRRAIALASPARPHPNPKVGALVVTTDGEVVGEGAYQGPGQPHAEVLALAQAGPDARGATVVVTLEPCVHLGRTAPCLGALVDAGVRRVVVGAGDPDPRVAGRGLAGLRESGIEVLEGVLSEEAEALDPGYFHHRRTGRPRVTLKQAVTLDGQAAALDGSSQWITSPEARRDAHHLRAWSDAVMVGAGTVLADDPRLTVRLNGQDGPGPLPIVVAGRRALPLEARLFARKALVLAPRPVDLPAEVVVAGDGEAVDLQAGLAELGRRGIVDLLVEGGPTLAASLVGLGLVDRGVLYLGARLAGGVGLAALSGRFETLSRARRVRIVDLRQVGGDVRVEFLPES